MKWKLGIAFVVMFLLFALSKGSTHRRQVMVVEKLGARIVHLTTKEHIGAGDALVKAVVSTTHPLAPGSVRLHYKIGKRGNLFWAPMERIAASDTFAGAVPHQEKGRRVYYYLQVETPQGQVVTAPDAPAPGGEWVSFRFKGKVNLFVTIGHVLCMFAAVFILLVAFFYAFDILCGRRSVHQALKPILWALLFLFIGGFPLGWIMNAQTFGSPWWEAFPFGWDITDNKTQLVFLYWLVLILLVYRSLFTRDSPRDLIRPKQFAWLTILGTLLTLGIYLIPHSLFLP
jgi:di/tricarboxylate transporter